MCNNMTESQECFPQLHKLDKNVHSFFDSMYLRVHKIRLPGFAEGSRLIPKELKRILGCDTIRLFSGGYTDIYICQNSRSSTF